MTKLMHILLAVTLLAGNAFAADQERKLVNRQEPEYPAIAARMNLRGTVKLKIWISPEGTVRRMEYIGGHPLLAEAALKAVKTWRYQPAAGESTATVTLKF
jgi:TonB family protein